MYLDKLNDKWSAYLETTAFRERLRITNSTKLKVLEKLYMLEFIYDAKRYHFYHVVGEAECELRELDETYNVTSFEAIFGINEEGAKAFLEKVNAFMLLNYEGIQTSVDCSEGVEKAKKMIQERRLG